MAGKSERLAQRLGLVERYPGAWHEPAQRVRRRRAGYLLIALSFVLLAMSVVLVVVGSTLAGVIFTLVGLAGLGVYVLITRKNRAREAVAE